MSVLVRKIIVTYCIAYDRRPFGRDGKRILSHARTRCEVPRFIIFKISSKSNHCVHTMSRK